MKPRRRSTAGSITWPPDGAGRPGNQPKLALVFLAVVPVSFAAASRNGLGSGPGPGSTRSGGTCAGDASISTDAPATIVPSTALASLRLGPDDRSRPRRGARARCRSPRRRLPPRLPAGSDRPASASASARNIDRLRGWTVKSRSDGTGEDCQCRARDLLAADRPAVVKRQGERRRVVGIRDRRIAIARWCTATPAA